jgi:hypothetical protein
VRVYTFRFIFAALIDARPIEKRDLSSWFSSKWSSVVGRSKVIAKTVADTSANAYTYTRTNVGAFIIDVGSLIKGKVSTVPSVSTTKVHSEATTKVSSEATTILTTKKPSKAPAKKYTEKPTVGTSKEPTKEYTEEPSVEYIEDHFEVYGEGDVQEYLKNVIE